MVKIGLISDTHGYLDQVVFDHFANCDEIWHAGDFGNIKIAEQLKSFKPLKGVYGNIDGSDIRGNYPEKLTWQCEGVNIFMIHIGGFPPKYIPGIKQEIVKTKSKLFI